MADELGQINSNTQILEEADRGANNGVAELNAAGLLPTSQIPQLPVATVKQDSANWTGDGQKLKVGSTWVWYDSQEDDPNSMHDNTVSESGTANGTHSATTLQDTSKSWTTNEWAGYLVRINGGTNDRDVAKIVSNTADTLTVDANCITTVDNTSQYEISLAGRITVPENGRYLVTPRNTFTSGASTLYGTYVYVNGAFRNNIFMGGLSVESVVAPAPQILNLSAGDYIEVRAYSGTAGKNLLSIGSRVLFSVIKLSN